MDTAPDPQLGSNVYEVVGIAVPSEVNTRISDVMVYYMLQIYSRDGGNLTSNKKTCPGSPWLPVVQPRPTG